MVQQEETALKEILQKLSTAVLTVRTIKQYGDTITQELGLKILPSLGSQTMKQETRTALCWTQTILWKAPGIKVGGPSKIWAVCASLTPSMIGITPTFANSLGC